MIIALEGKSRVKKMGRVAGWGCYCKEGGTAEKVTLQQILEGGACRYLRVSTTCRQVQGGRGS